MEYRRGYYIIVKEVDDLGRQAFMSIWNESEMLKEELFHSGDKFGEGALIPGLSIPTVALLMLITAILLKKRE